MKGMYQIFLLLWCVMLLLPCSLLAQDDLPDIDISSSPLGVVPLPASTPAVFTKHFTKYTKLVAPNGKPIHFLIQSGVSDLQAVKAREIMAFYLMPVPGSTYGEDKTSTANKLGDNKATLIYTDTEAAAQAAYGDLGNTALQFQDLYATESPIEGSADYLNNTGGRDASYEEIMHLCQGKGFNYTIPEYSDKIQKAADAAKASGIWTYPNGQPGEEYVITAIDVYYGLWEHTGPNGVAFNGEYDYNTREKLLQNDPAGYELVPDFLPPYWWFTAYLDPTFSGVFTLTRDESVEYTYKSSMLLYARLTGDLHSGLRGNDQNNRFQGNKGNNLLDGMDGIDTAVFQGARNEYKISQQGDSVIVSDNTSDRDAIDTLVNMEFVIFSDGTVDISSVVGISLVNNISRQNVLQIHQKPLSPQLIVSYTISEPQSITLTIYTTKGKRIKSMTKSYTNTGLHSATFDLSNFSSGMYLIKCAGKNTNIATRFFFAK